eukprot:751518-Hanusia_phi.AAC.1
MLEMLEMMEVMGMEMMVATMIDLDGREKGELVCGAIILSRIRRVVFGARDIKTGCAGSVLDLIGQPKFNHVARVKAGAIRLLRGEAGRQGEQEQGSESALKVVSSQSKFFPCDLHVDIDLQRRVVMVIDEFQCRSAHVVRVHVRAVSDCIQQFLRHHLKS